jgi:hypothetical protein
MRAANGSQRWGRTALARRYACALPRLLPWVWALVVVVSGCSGPGVAHVVSHAVVCRPRQVPGYSNHRSYPPGIPTLPPPGAHIVGCFASTAQAVARGFPLPVPHGTLIVHGVFLLPTGAAMRAECRVSARVLGFAVPCPGLLPSPSTTPLQSPDCGVLRGCVALGRLFVFDDGFVAPPGYHGVGGMPDGHVVIVAVRAATVTPGSAAQGLFCLHRPALRNLTIGADRVTFVACPEGSYETGGHVLARWVHHGVMVGVSVHGINATNIDLDLAMARHMTWISQSGRL